MEFEQSNYSYPWENGVPITLGSQESINDGKRHRVNLDLPLKELSDTYWGDVWKVLMMNMQQ